MSEQTPGSGSKTKKSKKAKLDIKMIFGMLGGTLLLFLTAFFLSYILMGNGDSLTGNKSLEKENKQLRQKIVELEDELSKYTGVDVDTDDEPTEKYDGAAITPGKSEPSSNSEKEMEATSTEGKGTATGDEESQKGGDKDNSNTGESSNKEPTPSNTGVSDAPVEVTEIGD